VCEANAQQAKARPKPKAQSPATLLALLFTVVATACSDCPRPFELSERRLLAPGQGVVLTVPDGELDISGRERQQTLEVRVSGCGASRETRIEVDTGRAERNVRIVAGRADVHVLLPAAAPLVVRHGAGRAALRAVGPLTLVQRAGDARVEQVVGSVTIAAGAGTLYVREVVGDVELMDGSGAMFVEGIMGDVRMRDGAGGIHLRTIEGDVTVESDGDGAIDARDVAGHLTVRAKTQDARMIRYARIGGLVTLPRER
jgi:hypothetical protein